MFEAPPLKLKLSSHYLLEEEETSFITEGLPNVEQLQQEEFYARYEIGEVIGEGTFSQVYLAKCKFKKEVLACKIIGKQTIPDPARMREEVRILSNVEHRNIVGVRGLFETEEAVIILLDFAEGGELFQRIVDKKRFSEEETKGILRALIEAASFLHSQGVIHRDIKPENILLASGTSNTRVLITDFSLAKKLEHKGSKVYDERKACFVKDLDRSEEEEDGFISNNRRKRRPRAYTSCGTDSYVAPEVLNSEGYGPQVDMWSLGVVMFILLCGKQPFGEAGNQLYADIRKGNYTFDDPIWNSVSSNAKDLLRQLLTVDPEKRISSEAARDHAWFQE